jgi:hypothetical protein
MNETLWASLEKCTTPILVWSWEMKVSHGLHTRFFYVCVEDLRKWSKGKKKAFRFGVPVIWREPKYHRDDCYFCCYDVKGYNSKNKKVILYPNLHSALRPVVHGPELPVPQPTEILEDASTNISDSGGDDEEFQCHTESQSPQLFTQSELNNVIELGLPKEKAELLGSRLKEKNLFAAGTYIYWYRNRKQECTRYFSQNGDIVHCCNIP